MFSSSSSWLKASSSRCSSLRLGLEQLRGRLQPPRRNPCKSCSLIKCLNVAWRYWDPVHQAHISSLLTPIAVLIRHWARRRESLVLRSRLWLELRVIMRFHSRNLGMRCLYWVKSTWTNSVKTNCSSYLNINSNSWWYNSSSRWLLNLQDQSQLRLWKLQSPKYHRLTSNTTSPTWTQGESQLARPRRKARRREQL